MILFMSWDGNEHYFYLRLRVFWPYCHDLCSSPFSCSFLHPVFFLYWFIHCSSRFQWTRGLRRRSAAARVLGLWVRIPPGAWTFVCCERCVLSGRGLCDELIIRPEESYGLWCVVMCDLETSWMRRPWPTGRCRANNKQNPLLWCVRSNKHISVRNEMWRTATCSEVLIERIVNTIAFELDVHESVHRDIITKTTNQMQLYRLIYYS